MKEIKVIIEKMLTGTNVQITFDQEIVWGDYLLIIKGYFKATLSKPRFGSPDQGSFLKNDVFLTSCQLWDGDIEITTEEIKEEIKNQLFSL